MDDEDSKARRNFIAVSTIIVLAWWLQAPLDKISEKLLGMSSVGPGFEWRAWFAALVALVYFALRFRFSKGHNDAAIELRQEHGSVARRQISRWLTQEAARYVRGGYAPIVRPLLSIFFQPGEASARAEVIPLHTLEFRGVQLGDESRWGHLLAHDEGQFKGSIDLELFHRSPGENAGVTTRERFAFIPTRRQRLTLWLSSSASLAIYSKASTTLFVPWILGSWAAVVCAWRIWQALHTGVAAPFAPYP